VGVGHGSLTEVAADVRHLHFRIAASDDIKGNAGASTVLSATEFLRMLHTAHLLPWDELVFKVLTGVVFLVLNALALGGPQTTQRRDSFGYAPGTCTALLIVEVPGC
jgi:hypothetical protein